MAKADKGHRFSDLRRVEGFGCWGLGRAFIVVGAKCVKGVVGPVEDEGFEAGMEAPTTRGTLAKHKRAVEGEDRMEATAEQFLVSEPVADCGSKHRECIANMDHPGSVAMEWHGRVKGTSRKESGDVRKGVPHGRIGTRYCRCCRGLALGHIGTIGTSALMRR